MDLIQNAQRLVDTLSDCRNKLENFIAPVGDGNIQTLLEVVDKLDSAISGSLNQWKEWDIIDPSHIKLSDKWAIANNELRQWEIKYDRNIYQPAKQLKINLSERDSWPRTVHSEPDEPASQDCLSVGEEICVGFHTEVANFWKMLKRDPALPQRILAFQVGPEQGKSILLRRLEKICQWNSQRDQFILFALVDFRIRAMNPPELVYEFVSTMQFNAAFIEGETAQHIQPLSELKSEAVQLPKGKRATSDPVLKELATSFTNCFYDLGCEKCTIVLILDTFEKAGEGGEWFLKYFLPMVRRLDNVIIVLAGQKDLDLLRSFENSLFCSTFDLLDYKDCQRWAELHYGIIIAEETAKQIRRSIGGSFQEINNFLKTLKVLKDYPTLASTLIPKPGG